MCEEKEHCFHCDKEIEGDLECDDCKKKLHQQSLRSRIQSMDQCISILKSERENLKGALCKSLGCGDPRCAVSTGICDHLTFGKGDLDPHGYWEKPCWECARAHEAVFPESGNCWPFTKEYLESNPFGSSI